MPIEPTQDDIGRQVIYHPRHGGDPEPGVLSSIGLDFVFVRYGNDAGGRATLRSQLEWAVELAADRRALDRDDYAKMDTAELRRRLTQVEGLRAEHMEAALQDAFAVQEITAVLAERGEL